MLKNYMEDNLIDLSLLLTEGINVTVKEPFTDPEVNLAHILRTIRSKIPKSILEKIDVIYVGDFDFVERAVYQDNAIYLSNNIVNEKEIISNIVHEIGAQVEEEFSEYLYGDDKLCNEFKEKRLQFYELLNKEEISASEEDFLNIEESESFEKFLFEEVGYSELKRLTSDIFYSPYSISWVEEYIKSGFAAYILGDKKSLKTLCPVLYNKIYNIIKRA